MTASAADYHLRMPADAREAYRLVERAGPGGRIVLRRETDGRSGLLVIAGFSGAEPPAAVTSPRLQSRGPGAWRLAGDEGSIEFRARAVDAIELHPGLFEGLHRRFALRAGERMAARLLLALLRLPGGARLLRRWHAGRGE